MPYRGTSPFVDGPSASYPPPPQIHARAPHCLRTRRSTIPSAVSSPLTPPPSPPSHLSAELCVHPVHLAVALVARIGAENLCRREGSGVGRGGKWEEAPSGSLIASLSAVEMKGPEVDDLRCFAVIFRRAAWGCSGAHPPSSVLLEMRSRSLDPPPCSALLCSINKGRGKGA